ncbi:hypothetical protein PV327_006172 [Microctonus hyperodae]|uniref:Uncharacterized protein n=1 Tax=Microctonus hyperodae TaxID=165561 RepID=A0AA39F3R9_MICHY|nr:hypothetical protein PV327_006172 [Microctonus hyperodae]
MNQYCGSRAGSVVYEYKNFVYHADSKYPGRRFVCLWKTAKIQCRTSALVDKGVVYVSHEHNHGENFSAIVKKRAIDALKNTARKDLLPTPHTIINEVFKEHQDAELLISPHCAWQHIINARKQLMPKISESLCQLPAIIRDFPVELSECCHGFFVTDEPKIWNRFHDERIIGSDWDFSYGGDARPNVPTSAQLLVVQIKKRNKPPGKVSPPYRSTDVAYILSGDDVVNTLRTSRKNICEAVAAVEDAMVEVLLVHGTADLQQKCEGYLRYLRQYYWAQIPHIVLVAGHASRTNNIRRGAGHYRKVGAAVATDDQSRNANGPVPAPPPEPEGAMDPGFPRGFVFREMYNGGISESDIPSTKSRHQEKAM